MSTKQALNQSTAFTQRSAVTVFPILLAVSMVHLINDTMQSIVSALFPILKTELSLSYTQIGMIALAMNLTASLLQPFIGQFADKRPSPWILPTGVCFTLVGIIALALAPQYMFILLAVICIGVGSAIFHPESSRVAYLAAGPRRGLAQAIFQVGGNFGSSLGPVMTALLFVHIGQFGVIWFGFILLAGIAIQMYVAKWYRLQLTKAQKSESKLTSTSKTKKYKAALSTRQVTWAMVILILLVVSKMIYSSSMSSYYTFYLINDYGVSVGTAQWFLFAFLASAALGTFLGGPMADRFGRRNIIWFSILGASPFSILLPFSNLFWSGILAILASFIMASAFSIIVVYGQELIPGKIGFVAGLFFGLAFGIGGLGAAVLGWIADVTSIAFIMKVSGFLPLIGLLAIWLPKDDQLQGIAQQ